MRVPILKLGNLLIASIQVELSDTGARRFQDDLLETVAKSDADGVVIDIAALDVVDSYLARILSETAAQVNLLGTKAVLCGMQPAVALTLVEMGREMLGVTTRLDLDQAVGSLRRKTGTQQAEHG